MTRSTSAGRIEIDKENAMVTTVKTAQAEKLKSRAERVAEFAKRIPYPVAETNLAGAYALTELPKDIDVNTADSKSLLRHGILLRRPDEHDRPAVRALWDNVFKREKPFEMIVPKFELGPRRSRRRSRVTVQAGATQNGENAPQGYNWAGAEMDSTVTTGTWISVTGQYTVPTVSAPTGPGEGAVANGGWQSSTWVGIDGYTDSVGSNDVLQIGTEQDVDSSGNATYSAWIEWAVTNATLTGGITSISDAVTFGQTTPMSPALASVNGRLYSAWRGDGNDQMNIAVADDGRTFQLPPLVTADTSDTSPAICAMNGNLYLAWKGSGNDNLNLAQVTLDGNGVPTGYTKYPTLPDTSKSAPAICGVGTMLYLGWRGEGNDLICIMGTADGTNWTTQLVSGQTTPASPALAECNGQLFVAWRGDGNENLNVGAVALNNSNVPTTINRVNTFAITSPQNPALAGVNGFLYLSFIGDNGDEVYVYVSEDEGVSFPVAHSSSETSPSGPALAASNGLMYISWRGENNDLVNVAPVISSFDTYEYVASSATIVNFSVSAGDSLTASASYNSSTSGLVQLANHTTGQAFSVTLAPPPGANFNGKSIEWIMETPTFVVGGNPVYSAIPNFTTITFTGATGCSAGDKAMGDPSQGGTTEIKNAANTKMTTSTATTDQVTISFAG